MDFSDLVIALIMASIFLFYEYYKKNFSNWKIFLAQIFNLTLTWEQDNHLRNGGKDIIHFGDRKVGYFSGKVKDYDVWMKSILGK